MNEKQSSQSKRLRKNFSINNEPTVSVSVGVHILDTPLERASVGLEVLKGAAAKMDFQSNSRPKPKLTNQRSKAGPKVGRFCVNCRNHGKRIAVSGHKKNCKYQMCSCSLCILTKTARIISLMERKSQRQMDREGTEMQPASVESEELVSTVKEELDELPPIQFLDCEYQNLFDDVDSEILNCGNSFPDEQPPIAMDQNFNYYCDFIASNKSFLDFQ